MKKDTKIPKMVKKVAAKVAKKPAIKAKKMISKKPKMK